MPPLYRIAVSPPMNEKYKTPHSVYINATTISRGFYEFTTTYCIFPPNHSQIHPSTTSLPTSKPDFFQKAKVSTPFALQEVFSPSSPRNKGCSPEVLPSMCIAAMPVSGVSLYICAHPAACERADEKPANENGLNRSGPARSGFDMSGMFFTAQRTVRRGSAYMKRNPAGNRVRGQYKRECPRGTPFIPSSSGWWEAIETILSLRPYERLP